MAKSSRDLSLVVEPQESLPTTEETGPIIVDQLPTSDESIPKPMENCPITEEIMPTLKDTSEEGLATKYESGPTPEENSSTTEKNCQTADESWPTKEESSSTVEKIKEEITPEDGITAQKSGPTTEESTYTIMSIKEETLPTSEECWPTAEESWEAPQEVYLPDLQHTFIKRQKGRVCRKKDCKYCNSPPCGTCGNCLHPENRNKCRKRLAFFFKSVLFCNISSNI